MQHDLVDKDSILLEQKGKGSQRIKEKSGYSKSFEILVFPVNRTEREERGERGKLWWLMDFFFSKRVLAVFMNQKWLAAL